MLFGLGDIRMRRLFIDDEDASPEHKRRAHGRLGTLIGYCETGECRRQILLNYFGENAAPCGNCDNCLDQAPRLDGTVEAKDIIAAVAQSGERFGPTHIVDILRGQETQKVADKGHNRLASFGTGTARKKGEWQSLIRQLVAGGFLTLDIGGHGGLSITGKGHRLVRGEETFLYRAETPRTGSRGKTGADQAETSQTDNPALLAVLKTLRLRLARERQVPAYVIFSDRTLADMAARCPRDLDAFAEVNGVGAAKLRDFGQIFLNIIATHLSG
jgi:ATP-dependent DNA helicase RecQ